jgi:hypothetical protein
MRSRASARACACVQQSRTCSRGTRTLARIAVSSGRRGTTLDVCDTQHPRKCKRHLRARHLRAHRSVARACSAPLRLVACPCSDRG